MPDQASAAGQPAELAERVRLALESGDVDAIRDPHGRRRLEQVWPGHADGIGLYFVQSLTPRDIGELARILDSLIQANQNHDQPG